MKKYIIIILILLGLGSCYFMNKNKVEKGTEISATKISLEDAKVKIDSLKFLTEDEKIELKSKLDEAKEKNNFDSILIEGEKLNSKNKIDNLEFLTEDEKIKFKNKIDKEINLENIKSILINSENINSKNKIDNLEFLTEDEKIEFKNKLNSITNLDELYTTIVTAEKLNSKNKIDSLNYLTENEKIEFKNRLNNAKNKDDFFAILKEAQEINSTRVSSDKETKINSDNLSAHFAFDSYKLTNADKIKIKEFINKHKISKISIVGHTDVVGTDEYNQKLSTKRAKAIFDYLKNSLKINATINYSGEGESNPISDIDAENRRAEIKLY